MICLKCANLYWQWKITKYGYQDFVASTFKHIFKCSNQKFFFSRSCIWVFQNYSYRQEKYRKKVKIKWSQLMCNIAMRILQTILLKWYACASGRINPILVEMNGINVIYFSDIYMFVFPPHLALQES